MNALSASHQNLSAANIKPGESFGTAEFVHIEGHTFAYPAALLAGVPIAPPNFDIKCEGRTFHFSREVAAKISGLIAPTLQFKDKNTLEIQERNASDIAFLFAMTLSKKSFSELDEETTWHYFELAQYLRLDTAEDALARRYVHMRLNRFNISCDTTLIDPDKVDRLSAIMAALDLSHLACLNHEFLGTIRNWPFVRHLDVHANNHLAEQGIQVIGGMTSLVSLNISDLPFLGDRALQHLSGLVRLRSLDMSGARCILESRSINILTHLTNLTDLKLNNSQAATTECLTGLQRLPLVNLELQACSVRFTQLCGLSLLSRLDYSGHSNLGKERLNEVANTFTALKELVLNDCEFKEPQVLQTFIQERQGKLKVVSDL